MLEVCIDFLAGRRRRRWRLVMGLTVGLLLLGRGVRDYVVLLLRVLLLCVQSACVLLLLRMSLPPPFDVAP